jgi:hypothetical protein
MTSRLVLSCTFACVSTGLASAQWSFVEEARLIGADNGGNQGYGSAVDVDGSTTVVGVARPQSGLSGRVFVYTRNAGVWTQQAELLANDDVAGNGFGSSVALEGNTLVIGASSCTTAGLTGAGAAYVFTRSGTTWSQQQKLTAFDAEQQAEFGRDVALSGNTCAIGSPLSTTGGAVFGGATYVFVRSGVVWTLQQRIVPVGNLYGARSGSAVALEGNSLLIGAPTWYDGPANQLFAGSAYEWTRAGTTWSQVAVIVPNDTSNGRQFGWDVALDGQRAVFGAWAESSPTVLNAGTAYVFRRNGGGGWIQEDEFAGAGIDDQDAFGTSVDISGTTVVVGAPLGASPVDAGSGTVRLFDFDGASWNERLSLLGSATSNADRLGAAVAIDAGFVIGGASYGDTPLDGNSGEAYVWRASPPATEIYCTAKTNSLGCVPAIGSSGTPSATLASPFLVSAAQVRNQKLGLLFYGFAPAATPFLGGLRCIGGPSIRTPVQSSGGNALPADDCSGAHAFDFNARIQSGVDPLLVAGEDVYCQWWTRDPGSAANIGLTDALEIRIQP